jgi:ribose/xylose/arabinose/galactoside ABC-type transport system permease subunit
MTSAASSPVPPSSAQPRETRLAHQARLRKLLNTLGSLLALVMIILGFALAIQIKGGLEDHNFAAQRARQQIRAGLAPEPVPTRWEAIYGYENRFLTANTFRSTANQMVSVGIAAMGMTMIIISGGIDLSVGSVMALTSVMVAFCLRGGLSPIPAALMAILLGAFCSLVNALMITRLKVVPFIATLGMWGIARGAAKGLAGEQKIDAPAGWLGTHVLVRVPEPSWLLISPGVWALVLLAAAVWIVLKYTTLGRHIFAIGSNETASRLSGVKVERTKLLLYSLAGFTTGLAGVMQFARLTVGDPTTAMGAELDVIAAVVIGGASLSGGEGSVFGSLVGALIMAFLRVGCDHVGVPSWVQEIVIGTAIVLAVALDYFRRRPAGRAA